MRQRIYPANINSVALLSSGDTERIVLTRPLQKGSNLSQGQRQLVSLARAMLTPSNILVLDEATAAVDVQTDAMLQATLRGPLFANRTIVTVAHRINTILDSDRVVVLERGEVVEFDTPQELIRKRGVFWGLVKEAGLVEDDDGEGDSNSNSNSNGDGEDSGERRS